MAKALEYAGKKQDIDFIREHHGTMLTEYSRVIEELFASPLISAKPQEQETAEETSDLPRMDEEQFDRFAAKLEDAMYALDEGAMLEIISEMETYQYLGASMKKELEPIRKKVEKSDCMSAVDTLSQIREKIKNRQKGE
jgi:hypothetical protein